MSAIDPYDPSCSVAFGFSRPYGPCGLAAHRPSVNSTALVASLLDTLRPIRPWINLNSGFGRPHDPRGFAAFEPSAYTVYLYLSLRLRPTPRPSWLRCLSAFGIYGLPAPQPSAMADPRAFRLRCLSAFGLFCLSCSAAFRVSRHCGHRGPSAYQSSVYVPSLTATFGLRRPLQPRGLAAFELLASTAKVHRRLRLLPTSGPSWPRWLSAIGLYGPSCSATFGFSRP